MIFDPTSEDTRLVQTAVVGHPNSDHAVNMPIDQEAAQEFKERYRRTTLWCGTMIPGGCGVQLSAKIYRDRVCHFAHHPSPLRCTRVAVGRGSADHLHAKSHLSRWLSAQNRRVRSVGWEADSRSGNPYSRVALSQGTAAPRIYVEFSGHYDATLERLVRDTRKHRHTDWLIRGNPRLIQFLLDEDGHAFRLRFRDFRESRLVEVGTQARERSGDVRVWWQNLDECVMTESGLVTPALRELRKVRLLTGPTTPRHKKQTGKSPMMAWKKPEDKHDKPPEQALRWPQKIRKREKTNPVRKRVEAIIRKAEEAKRKSDVRAAKSAVRDAQGFLRLHPELFVPEAKETIEHISDWIRENRNLSSDQPQKKTAMPHRTPETRPSTTQSTSQ